jgi:hypothetical protein
MKKIIIGLSGILIAAFIVIKVANAQNSTQEVKKSGTEMSKDCGKCPSSSACGNMKYGKTSEAKVCDPAKCKEGKTDSAACKAHCTNASTEAKQCPASAGRCCSKK